MTLGENFHCLMQSLLKPVVLKTNTKVNFILFFKARASFYLMCVKRKGIVSFIASEGSTSANKMAPVETGLQSLELFAGGLGVGSVLYL